ncbi:MAG: hypothetical protein ACK4RV_15980 [Caulobacter sp.]
MRVSTALLLLLIAVVATIGAYGWTTAAPDRARDAGPPPTGMQLLAEFRCFKPQKKVVVVRGREDGFSPAGAEPQFVRPGRSGQALEALVKGGGYDQTVEDRGFTDSIQAPERVMKGLFVIGLKPLPGSYTDSLMIGDLTYLDRPVRDGRSRRGLIDALDRRSGWRTSGSVRYASMADIAFDRADDGRASPASLLDYVQTDAQRWIDVMVMDDTSVDFMGFAFCVGPPPGKGATYAPVDDPANPRLVVLACTLLKEDHACGPFTGDTDCDTELPLACFKGGEEPYPRAGGKAAPAAWTGGRIRGTEPVRGSRFATIGEANAFCAGRFGQGWRVLRQQDGARANAMTGYGSSAEFRPRAWADIVDQPHATCWRRK